MFKIKNKTLLRVAVSQISVMVLFVGMTISNELFDLPYLLLGDPPTSLEQRTGEIMIELAILTIIMIIEIVLIRTLYRRIRILEGFLPICANCKKVRHKEDWKQIDEYISEHSLAKFTHSICPDCMKKLYPEIYDKSKKGNE